MAGAEAAAEAAAGFPLSPAPPARRELFPAAGGGASPRWWWWWRWQRRRRQQRRRLRSAVPPGLGLLGLVFSRFCCSALAGPIVDPHVTAVWGKKVALKCIIDVNETITQVSWEKIHGKSSQTIAVHHPEYGISVQGEYQGRVSFKNYSLTDATIILRNVSFSDAGEYICKAVTFPLGNTQSSTTVTVLVEPVVSLTKGPNPLIDGANRTIAATCTAATGKPAAEIDWEGGLGEMESSSILFPNETVTVVSQYMIVPTRFARGRRITCIVRHPALEKEIRYPHVLDIQYAPEVSVTGYDGNWFIGRENVQLRCNADANPLPMEFMWTRLDGQWPDGLLSVNNTLQFSSPLTYNYTGTYICKVTNSLGQRSDQKTIYILDPPTTTTRLPTVPWHPSTDGITGLATEPRIIDFPSSTLPAMQEDTWGTVIGSAVGGALFLILVSVLVGIICYRRRRTFRGDYFAKNYIPPSDMQKESQIDVLQSDDVDSYPDSIKKEIKHPMNSLISKDYLEDPEKPEWNNIDNINRYQERYERPMDYYEGGTLGMKYMGGECYDDNEEDFVSHIDGSVISRREWYV
ncbi:nectin-3 isoform X1 [Falco biarmicus]|uniref:nectin-3 isoform X1 n=1 Tax=Falco rusticolus TaxID=120794 RepID=UPI0018866647|nr:nectin-3 isoform X1 [Falco rusticolus]XP_055557965.1 nectin-3 isoform X1 [Falco cherrug]XP_055658041.1 nectin-3 isoform X1 [Falco peregrinus]XP_056184091.1 nectin-3 isoform X1 [Falco biarmicus]